MPSYIVLRSFPPYAQGTVVSLTTEQYNTLAAAHPNSIGPIGGGSSTGTTTSSTGTTSTGTTTTGTGTGGTTTTPAAVALTLTAGPGITIVTNPDGSQTITDTAAATGNVLIGD